MTPLCIARSLSSGERSRVRQLAISHKQAGRFVGAELAAREFFGESLAFDNTGFPSPGCGQASQHVTREIWWNGSTARRQLFLKKLARDWTHIAWPDRPLRPHSCLSGKPQLELLKTWYDLRHDPDPDILARTLPA